MNEFVKKIIAVKMTPKLYVDTLTVFHITQVQQRMILWNN